VSGALLDTSVVIAGEEAAAETDDGRTAAISVLTLGELHAGVLLARDPAVRTARQARLAAIRAAFAPLPVDEAVAERYGEVLATAREEARITKATDLLIVATAGATGRVLATRDERQARLARACGVQVA
jgi:predicted nucleic acid-binding protein